MHASNRAKRALGESYREAAHMRDTLKICTLETFTPCDQTVRAGSALKQAMEQSEKCEKQLTALLEDKEKALLTPAHQRRE